jgi:hypothetical protein
MENHIEERLNAIEAKLNDIERVVVKTRKVQKQAATIRAVYWVFIILLAFGSFYFIQPFITQLKDMYGFSGASESQDLQELLRQLQGNQ